LKQNKLTSKQLKERKEYERMAVVSPIQKKPKAKTTTATDRRKQSEIEIHRWLNYSADQLLEITKQIESIQKVLRQVGSFVRANYLLK
jgi:hypothetical protein